VRIVEAHGDEFAADPALRRRFEDIARLADTDPAESARLARELEDELARLRGPAEEAVGPGAEADRPGLLEPQAPDDLAPGTPEEIGGLGTRFEGDRFSADMTEEDLVLVAQELFPDRVGPRTRRAAEFDPRTRGEVVLQGGRVRPGRGRPRGSTVPDLYLRGTRRTPPISLEAKNYFLGDAAAHEEFILSTVEQARKRAAALPRTAEQHIVIDLRGQDVTQEFADAVRRELSGRSGGLLRLNRIHFLPRTLK
jgi:hypothetical protein